MPHSFTSVPIAFRAANTWGCKSFREDAEEPIVAKAAEFLGSWM